MQQQMWGAAPPPPAQPQQLPAGAPTQLEDIRTLWIGDLQYWVEESYLHNCFAPSAQPILSIKIIRNKITGQPEGYGFVEFATHAAAERILQTYNGTLMPGTELPFRLNWASFGLGERRDAGPEHSIFVGDLAPDVTDYLLQETFRTQYLSVRGAKVVTDPSTGRSKGYGFVKFSDEMERNRAMTEMNGVYCSTRPMRISAATPKKVTGINQYPTAKAIYPTPTYAAAPVQPFPVDNDVTNTTIFIGNLDPNVSEDELKQIFIQFGEVLSAKIPAGRGCGFVQFVLRSSAEDALQRMNGCMIGQHSVRLSWGRSPTNKPDQTAGWAVQSDPNQWGAYYGYGHGYDNYGYGASHDPSLYGYNAYAGFGQYSQQAEAAQDVAAMTGACQAAQPEEFDPLAPVDVDRLNAAYLSVHESAMVGRPLWLSASSSHS